MSAQFLLCSVRISLAPRICINYSIRQVAAGATDIRTVERIPDEAMISFTMSKKDYWRSNSLQNSNNRNYGRIRSAEVYIWE